MARSGGEADKLGNRYEGVWTVDSLLDVLTHVVDAMVVEPLDKEPGIEFYTEQGTGEREYHSVKRQTTSNTWTIAELCYLGPTGRSILGDLIDRIRIGEKCRACFVSTTTANQLAELRALAGLDSDVEGFHARLAAQPRVEEFYQRYVSRLLPDRAEALNILRRLRVVGFTESELIRRVDQRIRYVLYRPDGGPVDPAAVRALLGDAVSGWLATRIGDVMIRDFLAAHGWREQDWRRDATLRERVQRRNATYAQLVEAELIHGAAIKRKEAEQAIALIKGGAHDIALLGAAGMGKSCVLAQIIHGLSETDIPHLTLRLDVQTEALSTDAFGRALGFPTSPAIVLAALAQGQRSVLVIDQLDALSLVSGRNQGLWMVFEELLAEARVYPQMRVVLACREFDATNDHRLKRLFADDSRCQRLSVAPLELAEVKVAVELAGVNSARLTSEELRLLQTPQNLSLFLQSGPAEHGQVGSVQTLLDRYALYKRRRVEQRLGRSVPWWEVVKTLANWLSEHQTLSAPSHVLDAYASDIEAMASEHVLVWEEKSIRFFHESVFDYVFARTFVAQGGTAMSLLLGDKGEQHLFRRGQVRQILTYSRDHDFPAYFQDLQRLLTDATVRIHIKKLVFDWLRGLRNPRREEWTFLDSQPGGLDGLHWWRMVPFGSVPWFDLLHQTGTWTAWLRSDTLSGHAIWLLSQETLMRQRSPEVVDIVEPFLDGTTQGIQHFRDLLRFAEPHHSRRMFELLLRGIRSGWLDQDFDRWWYHLHDFPRKAGGLAAELLAVYLVRQFERYPTGSPFPKHRQEQGFPIDYCSGLTQSAPEEFVRWMLPILTEEIVRRPAEDWKDPARDALWPYATLGSLYDFAEALFTGLREAMMVVARSNPGLFRTLTAGATNPVRLTLAHWLLPSWAENPGEFADECADYLVAAPNRLAVGYDVTSGIGGEGGTFVSRRTVKAIAPFCSAASYARLEAAIVAYRNSYESTDPSRYGLKRYMLLRSLPTARLGPAARDLFGEGERKFPQIDESPPVGIRVFDVKSPIPVEAMAKMNDANWISAMRNYADTAHPFRREFGKGGMHELAGGLQNEAQKNKPRFARLLLELPADIPHEYFGSLLNGLAERTKEVRAGQDAVELPALPLETLVAVVKRVHALPGCPQERAVCHAIDKAAEQPVPDELLALISDYATTAADPERDDWRPASPGAAPLWGGDPLMSGMNSDRGAAAWTISSLLFAETARWPKLRAAVQALAVDPVLAVRAVTVRCLVAVLNVDRAEAVRLFLLLATDADEVLSTGEVDTFLHYAAWSHYTALRPVLQRMLALASEHAREAAARQITVAAFTQPAAKEDFALVMKGDATARAAAAGVFAHNLGHPEIRAVCSRQLQELFFDPDKEVRAAASRCFHKLPDEVLNEETELIAGYLHSPAFADGNSMLMYALDGATTILPEIICAVPEAMIAAQQAKQDDSARYECYHLPEIILRLYRQTASPAVKLRCLDAIDGMLRYSIGDIDGKLGQIER